MLKSLPTVFRNEESDNQGLVKEMEDLARVTRMEGTKALLISMFILWLVRTLLTRHMDTIASYARKLNLDW